MTYGSVCSGIEAASVAWGPLGWKCAFVSEIEKFPCAVLKHHYPEVPNYGDMLKFKEWPERAIDVLVGGTPCQSFSVAGLRNGLADPRGNLTLCFLAVVAKYRPRWIVWENVPGILTDHDRAFDQFCDGLTECGYGWAWRVLDAQYRGLAQRRERVFVIGCSGGAWQRAAAVLFDGASLCGNPPPSREKGKRISPTVEGRAGRSGANDFATSGGLVETSPSIRAQSQSSHRADSEAFVPVLSGTIGAREGGGCTTDLDRNGAYIVNHEINSKLVGRSGLDSELDEAMSLSQLSSEDRNPCGELSKSVAPTVTGNGDAHSGFKDEHGLIAHTLSAEGHDASEDGTGRGVPLVACPETSPAVKARDFKGPSSDGDGDGDGAPLIASPVCAGYAKGAGHNDGKKGSPQNLISGGMAVRRLVPEEVEALQGFPRGYTLIPYRGKPACDGPRYRALGNSFPVPVVAWIGRRIEMVSKLAEKQP